MHAARDAKRPLFSRAEQTTEPHFDGDDESQRALADAVDRLPVEQREVVVMKIWNELTFHGNRDCAWHFAKHGGVALSLCPNGLKKNLLPQ